MVNMRTDKCPTCGGVVFKLAGKASRLCHDECLDCRKAQEANDRREIVAEHAGPANHFRLGESPMIFKFTNTVDRDEDPIFVRADDETEARNEFAVEIGEIPASMLKVEAVDDLPDGETCIND